MLIRHLGGGRRFWAFGPSRWAPAVSRAVLHVRACVYRNNKMKATNIYVIACFMGRYESQQQEKRGEEETVHLEAAVECRCRRSCVSMQKDRMVVKLVNSFAN